MDIHEFMKQNHIDYSKSTPLGFKIVSATIGSSVDIVIENAKRLAERMNK